MRNLAIVLLSILLAGIIIAGITSPDMVPKTEYIKLQDSISVLHQIEINNLELLKSLQDSVIAMHDSIENILLRPMMTKEQFLQLYKFDRLQDYYERCKKDPVKWKYYKGWSIRVFEQNAE